MSMPFQVYLTPTTASPSEAQIRSEVRTAIAALGARIDADGVTVRTAEGTQFQIVGNGAQFLLDRLSPTFCRIVFNAALRTNSMVDRGGSDVTPLRMKGSTGAPRYADIGHDTIATPSALCIRLQRNMRSWNRFIRRAQREGVIGTNEEILGPPAAPGNEPRLTNDSSGIASLCGGVEKSFAKDDFSIVRIVVSQNPRWGEVWRADMINREYPTAPVRVVCWRRSGRPKSDSVAFSIRPLEMFDATKSVEPLEPER